MLELNQKIETLVSLFTIDKGEVKVLLFKKKDEPYKDYWVLPGSILNNDETIESNIEKVIYEKVGLKDIYFEQIHIYSDINRNHEERMLAVSHMALIDSVSLELKRELRTNYVSEWFNIDAIPKMAYDYNNIVLESINYLHKRIISSNVLKSLFPSDFTLPEIQNIYEQVLNKELDRRNFRKKFITLGLIEDTGYKNEGSNGRPAKLYRFKETIKERDLF